MDKIRVLRIYEFSGDRAAVERQIENSLHGDKTFSTRLGGNITIRAATLGTFPEILEFSEDSRLEKAYLALLNFNAHGTPLPEASSRRSSTWIGEKELRS